MAALNARTGSFIDLLLDLSGRVRTTDIADMSADSAAALLQEYIAAHPERNLTFDGQCLTPAAPAAHSQVVSAAPDPAPEIPAAPQASPWEFDDSSAVAMPAAPSHEAMFAPASGDAGRMTLDSLVPEVTSPSYGVPAEASAEPVWVIPSADEPEAFAPAAEWPAPDSSAQVEWGAPTSPQPEWESPVAGDAVTDRDMSAAPATYGDDQADGDSDFFELPALSTDMPDEPVSPLWWLAVVGFGFIGALVAWYVNRDKAGSKIFLIVGIVMLVISVLAAAAGVFFFMTAATVTTS